MSTRVDEALATEVSVARVTKPFGELTIAEVGNQAAALGEATGFGHRSRVGAVAAAWRQLETMMGEQGAARVAELDPATVDSLAERLWVVPPGGSLLP